MSTAGALKKLVASREVVKKILAQIDAIKERVNKMEQERAWCMVGVTRNLMKRQVDQNKALQREVTLLAAIDERLANQANANERLSKELISLVTYFKDAVIPKEKQLATMFVPSMTPQTTQHTQKSLIPKPFPQVRQATHLNDSAGSFITTTATPVMKEIM